MCKGQWILEALLQVLLQPPLIRSKLYSKLVERVWLLLRLRQWWWTYGTCTTAGCLSLKALKGLQSLGAKGFTDLSYRFKGTQAKPHLSVSWILCDLWEFHIYLCPDFKDVGHSVDAVIVPTSSVATPWCLHSVHLERQAKDMDIALLLLITADDRLSSNT